MYALLSQMGNLILLIDELGALFYFIFTAVANLRQHMWNMKVIFNYYHVFLWFRISGKMVERRKVA